MSSYDQNLLDEAPKATRAQLQEGYSVDLLEQPPRRTPSTVRHPPPPQLPQPAQQVVLTPGIAETGSGEKIGPPAYTEAPKPRTSFWRTRNGVITAFAIVLIVIGAVVGGAVGGTLKKSSNNNNVQTTGTDGVSSSPSGHTSSTATETATQAIAGSNRPTLSNSPVGTPVSTQGSGISEVIQHVV